MNKNDIANHFQELQSFICKELEKYDGSGKFLEDDWLRSEGGGGKTNIFQGGQLIEKGGVAFSKVFGSVSQGMKDQLLLNGDDFFATGVSIVLHPYSPHIPIIHMNIRYFESEDKFWFGGGIDLTPHIINLDHARAFHTRLKTICETNNQDYRKFKVQADDYFYLPHRNETRGVGGIFFDHEQSSKEVLFQFCKDLATQFPAIYAEQIDLGKNVSVSEDHKKWQMLRRGRYVEFNLIHDRGTKFGLFSGGRTESILMSMPPVANWEYNFDDQQWDFANKTQSFLKKGLNFLGD